MRLVDDVRYALRRIRRRPLAAVAPVVFMACGVAAAGAIFSVLDLVIFRSLAFPDADRLVAIYSVRPDQRATLAGAASWNRGPVSWTAWQSLRQNAAFDEIGAWFRDVPPVWGYPGEDVVEVWYVSSSIFVVLGARPVLGRLFTADEDRDDPSDAVLLTHECWQRRYGGRADVIGATVTFAHLPNEPQVRTIVGVLSPGFRLRGAPPEFLLPIGRRVRMVRESSQIERVAPPMVNAVGRLADGVSLKQAATVVQTLVPPSAGGYEPVTARVVRLRDDLLGESAPPSWLLAATTGILLVVACASVAGWFLSEASRRRAETAIRAALGASRRSLLAPLVIEQSLKACLAGVIGLAGAIALTRAFAAVLPVELLGTEPVAIGAPVWLSASAAFVTTLLFGIGPAWFVSRLDLRQALEGASGRLVHGRKRALRVIAAVQLALALVLVVCAALLGETLGRLGSRPLGFDPSRLIVASIKVTQFPHVPPVGRVPPAFASWPHTEEQLSALQRLPGVTSAAGVSGAPFNGDTRSTRLRDLGSPDAFEIETLVRVVTPGYFQTMGIPLLEGRGFLPEDHPIDFPPTQSRVVVSEELARRLGGNSVGRHVSIGPLDYEIVGLVEDVRQRAFADEDLPCVYLLTSTYSAIRDLVIRTSQDPELVMPSIVRAIRDHDRSTLVRSVVTMDALLARSIGAERFRAALSGVFGAVALGLAAFGVGALASRMVTEKRREIGVRAALGAAPSDIATLVIKDALRLCGIGLAVGLPVTLVAASALGRFLFGVPPLAPHVLVGSVLVLVAAVLVAVIGPARRATRVDPALVVRST